MFHTVQVHYYELGKLSGYTNAEENIQLLCIIFMIKYINANIISINYYIKTESGWEI